MRYRALAAMLKGGDRRSIGKSNQVAKIVLSEPLRFAELLKCLWHDDLLVRMRAADAAEKVTVKRPELLHPHKQALLGLLAEAKQIELRWHLALMVPRLELSAPERARAAAALQHYLDDRSSIVKTFALQGLTELAAADRGLIPNIREILEVAERSGTPAMRARARKLVKTLKG